MIKKFLTVAALVFGLAFGTTSIIKPANAASVVTNTTDQLFNAVDETSSTLVTSAGTLLTVFVSGTYAVENIVQLQREVGSPGSGAWESVTPVTGAATVANTRVTTSFTTGRGTEAYPSGAISPGSGFVSAPSATLEASVPSTPSTALEASVPSAPSATLEASVPSVPSALSLSNVSSAILFLIYR